MSALLASFVTAAATSPAAVVPASVGQELLAAAARLQVSLGGDLASCGRARNTAASARGPEATFRELTRGAGCDVKRVGAKVYVVRARVAARRTTPKPAPSRSSPPPSAAAGEILVTAGRRPGALERYAGALSVVPGAVTGGLTRGGVVALAGELASLETTNLGPGRDKIFLRGLSDGAYTGSATSTIAQYLDDLPITLNAPDPDLRLIDLDRVEVLEGPQGALYGSGSIAGVVRLVTAKPDLVAASGELGAGVVGTSAGASGSDLEAVLNLPLIADRLGVRAALYRERTGGYIDDLGLRARDVNSGRRDGGRVSILWRATPEWSVSASVTYQLLDTAGAQYVTGDAPSLSRRSSTPEPHDNDFAAVSVGAEGPLAAGRLRLSAAYVHHVTDTTYDATGADGELPGAPVGSARYDEGRRRDLVFGEALLTEPAVGRLEWQAGAFLAATRDRERNALAADAEPSSPYYREDKIDALLEGAIFGDVAYNLSRRWRFEVGARVFSEDQRVTSAIRQPALASAPLDYKGVARTRGAAPRVALEYRRGSLFAFVDFASGYRPATLNTTTVAGAPFDVPGAPARQVRADFARTWEAGLKFARKGGWLNAEVFYTDWLDVQSDQFTATRLPTTVNVGDAVIPGLELSARAPWRHGLAVTGSLMLDDPQLTRDRNLGFPSRADAGLPGVSSTSAALGLTLAREGPWATHLTAELHARYVGPSRLSFDAALDGRQGDYVTADGRLVLERGWWSVELAATNLGDSRADTFAFGDPFLPSTVRTLTPLRPRTVELDVRRRF